MSVANGDRSIDRVRARCCICNTYPTHARRGLSGHPRRVGGHCLNHRGVILVVQQADRLASGLARPRSRDGDSDRSGSHNGSPSVAASSGSRPSWRSSSARLMVSVECLSNWLDFSQRIRGWLRLLAPHETAGIDLEPRGGGWIGKDLRSGPPSRSGRGDRRGPLLLAWGEVYLGGFGRIRVGVGAGRRCRADRFRVDVRAREGRRILRDRTSIRLGPLL